MHSLTNANLKSPKFYGIYVIYFLVIVPASTWVLFTAPTWVGKMLAVAGLLIFILRVLFPLWRQRKETQKIWGRLIILIGITLVSFFAALLLATPSGNPGPDSPIQHRFSNNTTFNRYSLANIIPESEQMNFGFLVMLPESHHIQRTT